MTEIKENKTMNILVVNDEEEICKILVKYFSPEGARVKFSLTGEKAIELAKKEHFDLVFLDVHLPGISGIEVIDKIKAILPEAKIIMISGRIVNNKLINKVKKKGASGYLQKPFRLGEIDKILSNLKKGEL